MRIEEKTNLTADQETVLADKTGLVSADTAKKKKDDVSECFIKFPSSFVPLNSPSSFSFCENTTCVFLFRSSSS
jgi:hypothetical protein